MRTWQSLRGRGTPGRRPILNGPVQKIWAWSESQIAMPLLRVVGPAEEVNDAAKPLMEEVKKKAKEHVQNRL